MVPHLDPWYCSTYLRSVVDRAALYLRISVAEPADEPVDGR